MHAPAVAHGGPADDTGGTGDAAIIVRFWGVRGSVPTTCASAAGFGGNTPCLEVLTAAGRRIIFDAGTGIRLLGRELSRRGGPVSADLFLTHFHWDHIQGLPFFAPLRSPDTTLRIHAPRQGTLDGPLLLGKLASPTYVPVPLQAFPAAIDFHDVSDEPWVDDGLRVGSVRANHPAHTRAYRLDAGGVSLAYVPDHELAGPAGEDDALERLVAGVDVLVHDAMFTGSELAGRAGWGHSSMEQAVALARRSAARLLCLFHHDPARTDEDLAARVEALSSSAGLELRVEAAAEGDVIELAPGRQPRLARRPTQVAADAAAAAGGTVRISSSNC